MAFDGFTTAAMAAELRAILTDSYIARVTQPEKDAVVLTCKTKEGQKRLFLSAQASLPLVYLTEKTRTSPADAPAFCMLLRKYIGGGRIADIRQEGFDRVIRFEIDHRDELGDPKRWSLILELMGKHSNLILTDADGTILDAIKRIPPSVSSVREVLPGRSWFIPNTTDKKDPLDLSNTEYASLISAHGGQIAQAVGGCLTGFSRTMAEEACARASLDSDRDVSTLSPQECEQLNHAIGSMMENVRDHTFSPVWTLEGKKPVDYAVISLSGYAPEDQKPFSSVSQMVETFYGEKEEQTRVRQKSAALRQSLQTLTNRAARTLAVREKQYADTDKRDKYRRYGELIQIYGYNVPEGADHLDAEDYETGEMLRIPLDPQMTPQENAQKYFTRYAKLKRTAEELDVLIEASRRDLTYLESVWASLDTATGEADLQQIRKELAEEGYLRSPGKEKTRSLPSGPLRFRSSDGFEILVGKNNYQNEEITLRTAAPDDWFFHAQKMAGSHVIVRSGGREVPDTTFEEAGRLAAFYSRGKLAPKVEIDYTLKKNVHKPAKGRPGLVIYHTHYSMMASPDITDIEKITDEPK